MENGLPGPNDGWIAKDRYRAAAVMLDPTTPLGSGLLDGDGQTSREQDGGAATALRRGRGRRAHWASDEYTGGMGGGRCN